MIDNPSKFEVENISIELDKLTDPQVKIKYLIKIKAEYKQLSALDKISFIGSKMMLTDLVSWCDAEIEQLKDIEQLEKKYLNDDIENFITSEKIQLKTRFLFLIELGIIEHLKNKFSILKPTATDSHNAGLLSVIMGTNNKKDIENLRTYIRDLRNDPEHFKNETALKKVKDLMAFYCLK